MMIMKYRSYKVEGTAIDEVWIVKNRNMVEDHMRDDMRAHGFIPVLDIPTELEWAWDQERNVFTYQLTAFGKHVGKRKAKQYLGILDESGLALTKDGKKVTLASELASI
jgi:hypothetical protein